MVRDSYRAGDRRQRGPRCHQCRRPAQPTDSGGTKRRREPPLSWLRRSAGNGDDGATEVAARPVPASPWLIETAHGPLVGQLEDCFVGPCEAHQALSSRASRHSIRAPPTRRTVRTTRPVGSIERSISSAPDHRAAAPPGRGATTARVGNPIRAVDRPLLGNRWSPSAGPEGQVAQEVRLRRCPQAVRASGTTWSTMAAACARRSTCNGGSRWPPPSSAQATVAFRRTSALPWQRG